MRFLITEQNLGISGLLLALGQVEAMGRSQETPPRTARQWYLSVKTYLEWRAGCCWRPLSDRFHPVRLEYLRALDVLRDAFEEKNTATVAAQLAPAPEKCPGWTPARRLAYERRKQSLPPKKPVASVTAVATAARRTAR